MELVVGLGGLVAGLALGRLQLGERSAKDLESECLILTAVVEAYRSELAEVKAELLESRSQLDSLLEKELQMDSGPTQGWVSGLMAQAPQAYLRSVQDLVEESQEDLE